MKERTSWIEEYLFPNLIIFCCPCKSSISTGKLCILLFCSGLDIYTDLSTLQFIFVISLYIFPFSPFLCMHIFCLSQNLSAQLKCTCCKWTVSHLNITVFLFSLTCNDIILSDSRWAQHSCTHCCCASQP